MWSKFYRIQKHWERVVPVDEKSLCTACVGIKQNFWLQYLTRDNLIPLRFQRESLGSLTTFWATIRKFFRWISLSLLRNKPMSTFYLHVVSSHFCRKTWKISPRFFSWFSKELFKSWKDQMNCDSCSCSFIFLITREHVVIGTFSTEWISYLHPTLMTTVCFHATMLQRSLMISHAESHLFGNILSQHRAVHSYQMAFQ